MTKSLVHFAALLIAGLSAEAQDFPRLETSLGYTYVRTASTDAAPALSANGGSGQFAYSFNRHFSAVADVGAVHTGAISNRQVDATLLNFLFGPRLSLRYSQFRPYVQVLCGGVYMTSGAPLAGAQQTAFAMTAGGGLDIRINKLLSFRPVALDYELTRLQNLRTAGDNIQNSLRYTTGFNFTFGAR